MMDERKICHAFDVPPWVVGLEPYCWRNRIRWRLERIQRFVRGMAA